MAGKGVSGELVKAIRKEGKAARLNFLAAEQTDDPGGADMFQKLALFHRNNASMLEKFLSPEDLAAAAESIDAGPDELARMERLAEHADAFSALGADTMLENEMAAIFSEAAAKAETAEERRLLARLAEEKGLDRRMLEDEFYSLANTGLAVWGD